MAFDAHATTWLIGAGWWRDCFLEMTGMALTTGDHRNTGHSTLVTAPPPAAGTSRRGLSRPAIVDAAIALVDADGLAELTMRHVADRLDFEAMSLYRYVVSREALLDAMVEAVVDALYADPQVYLVPRHGWEDYLSRLAYGVRRIAMDHPRLFPLVATRPPAAPWVRPPLRSLRWMESFLAGLVDCGFTDDGAVAVYRAFTSFLLGHLLLDVAALNVDISAVADTSPGPTAADHAAPAPPGPDPLADYPVLRRMEPKLSQDFAAAEFESSLVNLLSRLATLRPTPA